MDPFALYSEVLMQCRTARGYEHGTALTFMTPDKEDLLDQLERKMAGVGGVSSSPIIPYKFRMSEVEGFRYRVQVNVTLCNYL